MMFRPDSINRHRGALIAGKGSPTPNGAGWRLVLWKWLRFSAWLRCHMIIISDTLTQNNSVNGITVYLWLKKVSGLILYTLFLSCCQVWWLGPLSGMSYVVLSTSNFNQYESNNGDRDLVYLHTFKFIIIKPTPGNLHIIKWTCHTALSR